MTQYSMDPVAKLGLLKMDFLGLTNLTILDRAVRTLADTQGININLSRLPLDDPETFNLISSGRTTDIFQLESAGMQRYIKKLKTSNLGDIAAMIALYRHGPMEHIDTFIDAKHGRTPVSYPHPSMKELLDETYGVIVYQDQALLILQNFAGYTLGEADTVHKTMGKKIPALMAREREQFIAGARDKGFDHQVDTQVFDRIEPFAGYAFNKAHSVSYALISYWTAYFKAHHPVEYMASVLNSRLDQQDKIASSINECSKLGIPVLPPDLNRSGELFSIDREQDPNPALRYGLAASRRWAAAQYATCSPSATSTAPSNPSTTSAAGPTPPPSTAGPSRVWSRPAPWTPWAPEIPSWHLSTRYWLPSSSKPGPAAAGRPASSPTPPNPRPPTARGSNCSPAGPPTRKKPPGRRNSSEFPSPTTLWPPWPPWKTIATPTPSNPWTNSTKRCRAKPSPASVTSQT